MHIYQIRVPSGLLRKEIQELQVAHADTISELEKTRKLLSLQHSVNKGCAQEVFVCFLADHLHVLTVHKTYFNAMTTVYR